MALDLGVTYAGRIADDSAEYPFGEPRNESTPGTNDGTPLDREWVRDVLGFLQGLLDEAGIVPSGTADNAVNSQYRDAMKLINSGLPTRLDVDGFETQWFDDDGLLTCQPGQCRNFNNTKDIRSDEFTIAHELADVWVDPPSGGSGIMSPAVSLPLAAGWYPIFIIAKPDGSVARIAAENALQIFGEAEVIAAGYTDSSLFRRIDTVYWDGSNMPEYLNRRRDGTRLWAVPFTAVDNSTSLQITPREEIVLTRVPPSMPAILSLHALLSNQGEIIITHEDQTDTPPTEQEFTMRGTGATSSLTCSYGVFETFNDPAAIYARRDGDSGQTISKWSVIVNGWKDYLADVADFDG